MKLIHMKMTILHILTIELVTSTIIRLEIIIHKNRHRKIIWFNPTFSKLSNRKLFLKCN